MFSQFKTAVQRQFNQMKNLNLYRSSIDKDKLWELYLSSFPEGTNPMYRERTEHDCSSCRQFVKNAGALVAIVDNKLASIWDVQVGGFYQVVADALATAVRSTPIENVFCHYENQIGIDKNYQQTDIGVLTWEHFHVQLPTEVVCAKSSIGETLGQYQAKKDVFQRGLHEITLESMDTVLELISQNSLYRGEEHKHTITQFLQLKKEFNQAPDKDLFCWHHAKQTSQAITHIRNSVIGTLLTDLSEGVDLERAVKAFEVKVAPSNYQRPTALVTKAMVDKARQEIEELGLTSALERRYAVLEDITINNVLFADRSARQVLTKDAFDEIATSSVKKKFLGKVEEISVDQFLQNILPTVTSLEVMVENKHVGNFVSLIAPCDLTAPNLFKWNNPFSWSYQGEMADSIKERVKAAGGNVVGDVCCRLAWDNKDDLDFHMVEPKGNVITYHSKREISACGGMLDLDANGSDGMRSDPAENIFYSSLEKMKRGVYELRVHQYYVRERKNPGFTVEVEVKGKLHSFNYSKAVRQGELITVAKLIRDENGVEVVPVLPLTAAVKQVWGLSTQSFHKVSTVMLSPNYWDNQAVGNKHLFFMLDGCANEGKARGFFNEFLATELVKHRKVMELVGAKMRTEESERQLSGLGFSSTQRSSVLCKVSGNFTRTIKINF